MRSTILALLLADSALMGALTGGLHDAGAVGEISRSNTPGAFDANSEILPCGLLRVESEAPEGPFPTSSRQFVVVYLYQRQGYTAIDTALARLFAVLHRRKLTGAWEARHVGDVRDLRDEALGCALAFSRFQITRLR